MWIFRKGQTLRESNSGIDAVPVFTNLTDKQLLYVYYVYDWSAPYFKAKLEDKKMMAARDSGLGFETKENRPSKYTRDIMNLKNHKVNEGIARFNVLQRATDIDRALLEALQAQIYEIMTKIGTPSNTAEDLKRMIVVSKALPDLIKQRKEIAEVVGLRDLAVSSEEDEIEKELSTLDELNESKQHD
jgi:hypothetical protein